MIYAVEDNFTKISIWNNTLFNVVIPGSKNPDHLRDNFALFDFSLTEEEMAEIAALDKKVRY